MWCKLGNRLIGQEQILPVLESTSTHSKATRLQWLNIELSLNEGGLNKYILPQDWTNPKLCVWLWVLIPHLLPTCIITESFPNFNSSYITPMKTLQLFGWLNVCKLRPFLQRQHFFIREGCRDGLKLGSPSAGISYNMWSRRGKTT